MSEQDEPGIEEYLHQLVGQGGDEADETKDRRDRAAVRRWEYMVWGVVRPNTDNARVTHINGRPPLNTVSLFDELERAGLEGWELVSTLPVGERRGAMFFRRPLAED